jgi:hypothetical protein
MAPRHKPVVGSYSLFNTFNICEYQCYRRYFKKDIPFVETPQIQWGNEVHSAMELRVGGKKPLPDSMRAYEAFAVPFDALPAKAEMWLGVSAQGRGVDSRAPNVWVRGKVDVHVVLNDVAFIADWKTGKTWEDPFELQVGAVLVHAKYPHLKTIKAQYQWLKEEQAGELYDVSDTRETWSEISRIMHDIGECQATDKWRKQKNKLCGWCQCFDCEFNTNPTKPDAHT